MEGVRTFLESSTIHGLTYISTTRKYARLFWFLVVITGFSGASWLIKESFDSWSETPVKTTMETLPISEIKLPKVTVCPPKNTFTDLNYDLMMTENTTLTQKMRDELFKYAVEVINEDSFTANNWTKLHEEDRFYNWYHGYTEITSPDYDVKLGLKLKIITAATSGVVTTEHFGEQLMSELIERKLYYLIEVSPPESVKRKKSVTLHFKMEKVSMAGLAKSSKDSVIIPGSDIPDTDQTSVYTNFTPPGEDSRIPFFINSRQLMLLTRDVSSEDVEQMKLDVMPGFNFSWWYSGAEVTPDNKYKDNDMSKQFVR